MKLIAIKPFSYSTRHYQAGDVFETKTERDGKLLLAVKKVRQLEDRPEAKISGPSKTLLNKIKPVEVETKPVEEEKPEVTEEVKEPEVTKVPEEKVVESVKEEASEPVKEEAKPFIRNNQNTGRGRTSRKN